MSEPASQSPIGVSFPKSGRTWMRAVLRTSKVRLTFTHAGHGSRGRELGRPFDGVPAELRDRPVVFLHRNPIDTAVSFFHQVNSKDFAPGTLKYWQRLVPLALRGRLPPRDMDLFVLHPTYGVEKVCRFNRAWIDHVAQRADSRIVTYEALRADPVVGFTELLRFLSRDTSGVEAAVADRSFENMRAREEARPDRPFAFLRPDRADAGARKARRAKVAGYVDELTPEAVAAARRVAGEFGFDA